MKSHLFFPACLLLLWTLTAFVSGNENAGKQKEIKVKKQPGDKIVLECPDSKTLKKGEEDVDSTLEYKDENSGEYKCTGKDGQSREDDIKIYVKFRTCDNCIELDTASVVGMVAGDVVATIIIGVAVYLIASQGRITPITSQKKIPSGSDRQHLVPNEVSSRAPNDHYERLRHKGQKDMYDVINNRK